MTLSARTSTDVGETTATPRSIGDREFMLLLSATMALMGVAVDMLLPAFDDIRESFDMSVDSNQIAQIVTVFFFGMAVAQLVWGPLADRFGRRQILFVGIGVYVIGAAGSAVAPGLAWLLVFRFVWGVGAAAARVVVTAVVRDRFEGVRMAEAMSHIMVVFLLVPVLAPVLGAGVIAVLPWQSLFWLCVVWAASIAVWSRRLPETLDPRFRRPIDVRSVLAGFGQVVRNRETTSYTVAQIFLFAIFISYLGSSERIISEVFDRERQFPFIFAAIAAAFGVCALINGRIVGRFGILRLVRAALGLALVLSGVLVGVSVAADGEPRFWIFMPVLGLLLGMMMFLMPNLSSAALEPMGELAGTASSVTSAARMAGGAVLGGVVNTTVEYTVTPFALAIAVFVVLATGSTLAARPTRRLAL